MKRRYPGDSAGPLGPGGFPGRRPNDPRYRPFPGGGNMGPPRGPPGGPPPPPPRRSGSRQPQIGQFHRRGAPGFPSRGGPGSTGPPGRGPPIFRGGPPRGSRPQGMGRSPPIVGRGNMMGTENGMMGRGSIHGRPPPMMERGPPSMIERGPSRPGPPNHFSNIPPPPPPRGKMGHPPSVPPTRPPFPNTNFSPPPIRNPRGGMGPPLGQNIPPQFQELNLQVPTSNLQLGFHPSIGGRNPSYPTNGDSQQRQRRPGATSFASGPSFANTSVNMPITVSNSSQQTTTVHPKSSSALSEGSKPTAQQIDDAWKEYTAPNGMKYYHNAILKESTYTKPITLAKKQTPMDSQASTKRKWQEYEDATSGKKYYSDGVTTTWEKPNDFDIDPQESIKDEEKHGSRKQKEAKVSTETSFSSKSEAIAAFKGLLLARAIAPAMKWGEVLKTVASDARWSAFESALTLGERRQALAEYQTKRANELKNLERQERIRAKDAFGQLLADTLPTITAFSVFNSRFSDVRVVLAKDDRFHAVATEEMRETLFHEFCEELRKRDERKKRSKRRETHDAFVSFLREQEEAGNLTFTSTWDSFLSSLDKDIMKDSRFDVSGTMSDSDRQLYFSDFVIELHSAQDEKRRRIRDARRRAEKAQRDAYREVLQKLAAERKISPSSRWRSIEEIVAMDQAFNLVEAQDRDSPRSLFEEFVGEWDDVYRHDKAFLSRLINSSQKKESDISSDTTYEEFTKLLLELASISQESYADTRQIVNAEEPVSSARLYFDELVSRASGLSRRVLQQRQEDSSEDEGEIIEDSEIGEEENKGDEERSKEDHADTRSTDELVTEIAATSE